MLDPVLDPIENGRTASAGECCKACNTTPGCNMWTWTKSYQGCYLKREGFLQDDGGSSTIIYVARFDKRVISGGWDSSVHIDEDPNFHGGKTGFAIAEIVKHGMFNHEGVLVDHMDAHSITHSPLHPATNSMMANDATIITTNAAKYGKTSEATEATEAADEYVHRRLEGTGISSAVEGRVAGVDYISDDYITFSSGRVEALNADNCEQACASDEKCEYWGWSHNDPRASCYLKSKLAMVDKQHGYGYPTRCFGAMSGFMRGGTVDSVGASPPQNIPATVLRKQFDFVTNLSGGVNRPELYMVGSGITHANLGALTIGVAESCHAENWTTPCFTAEEISYAATRLNTEQAAFNELSAEEQAAHAAAGGQGKSTM